MVWVSAHPVQIDSLPSHSTIGWFRRDELSISEWRIMRTYAVGGSKNTTASAWERLEDWACFIEAAGKFDRR